MSETNNKSYRIKANVGADSYLNVKLDQDYDSFDILSLNIDYKDTYRLHNSDKGIIVGRVLANNGFGIPNAKISIFISADTENDSEEMLSVYNYSTVTSNDINGVRYNLLENYKVSDCHRPVGTFPSKRYLLDNDTLIEVFDKYYTLTTKTNEAGDYMLVGVPKGNNTIHMDLDLSDCGILSQKPRDFVYKGYNIEQFDSPSQFKTGTTLNSLSQIFSQDTTVYVNPFWGNDSLGETIGISRCDINVNFKFEPTCVFIGSVVSDPASKGISKDCIPNEEMGRMDELTTGEGTIEMIRKTPSGDVEVYPIKGTLLIDGDGVWCYQIPMNLDYVVTDEYGNMVATDDPEKGIPTRTRVRFRMSMSEFEKTSDNHFRAKILVPHNPQYVTGTSSYTQNEDFYDYDFGTKTKDESFRDLMWNNVYTVKQYIPRFQKSKQYFNERFTGIKACNHYGQNNPMPYNNIRIKLPFMFRLLCALIKAYIRIVTIINKINAWLCAFLRRLSRSTLNMVRPAGAAALEMRLTSVADGLCPDLENWYFTPYNGENITGPVFHSEKDAQKTYLDNSDIDEEDSATTLCNSLQSDAKEQNEYKTLKGLYKAAIVRAVMSAGLDVVAIAEIPIYRKAMEDYIKKYVSENAPAGLTCENKTTAYEYCETHDQLIKDFPQVNLYNQTLNYLIEGEGETVDTTSIDYQNRSILEDVSGVTANEGRCLTTKTDYLISCIEMNLAQEYRVINFDFYNDWINGVLYFPRWNMEMRPKKKYRHGKTITYTKTLGCIADPNIYSKSRKLYQQCSLKYTPSEVLTGFLNVNYDNSQNYHKNKKRSIMNIFGNNGGVIKQKDTMLGQTVYYYKPCEWIPAAGTHEKYNKFNQKINLFATDVVLLGSMDDCSKYGIPKAFEHMTPSSYKMPTNLALTNMDTNAYLYGTSDGTFCAGNHGLKNYDYLSADTTSVSQVSQSYASQDVYYGTMTSEEERISYGDDFINRQLYGDNQVVIDDLFPITETAGIAWNYTGPGQGTADTKWTENKFGYQPGGHFLGLSCNNSQTNMKSCLNLQRICEMGVTMSQRRTKVYGMNGNLFKYKYFVPTGYISTEDIADVPFRSMFATMNMRPLVVSSASTDSDTGYQTYSFLYRNPNSFNGEILSTCTLSGTQYNEKVDMSSEKADFAYMMSANSGETGLSFDANEFDKTFRKTFDFYSPDYTSFRFGVANKTDLKYHFAIKPTGGQAKSGSTDEIKPYGYYEIPIYENSFYFYFGLHEGSTAFDKFKDNFYSTCDTSGDTNSAYIVITKDDIAKPTNNKFSVTMYNMQDPYDIVVTSGSKSYTAKQDSVNTYSVSGLSYGTYKVSVQDDNGTVIETTVSFKEPVCDAYYLVDEVSYDKDREAGYNTLQKNYLNDCGYIDVDRIIRIDDIDYDLSGSNVCLLIQSERTDGSQYTVYYYRTSNNSAFDNAILSLTDDEKASGVIEVKEKPYILMDIDSIKMYMPDNLAEYSITMLYKCSDGQVGSYIIGQFTV